MPASAFDVFLPAFRTGADIMREVLNNRLATQRHNDEVGLQLAELAQRKQYQDAQVRHLSQLVQMADEEKATDARDEAVLRNSLDVERSGAGFGFAGGLVQPSEEDVVRNGLIKALPNLSIKRSIPILQSLALNDQKNQLALGLADIRAQTARDILAANIGSREKIAGNAEAGRNARAEAQNKLRQDQLDAYKQKMGSRFDQSAPSRALFYATKKRMDAAALLYPDELGPKLDAIMEEYLREDQDLQKKNGTGVVRPGTRNIPWDEFLKGLNAPQSQ